MNKYLVIFAVLVVLACSDDGLPHIDYTADGWAIYAGLEWSPRSTSSMKWDKAEEYCAALGARLPTIDELRRLIINCPDTASDGLCPASDPDCLNSQECYVGQPCQCKREDGPFSVLGDDLYALWSSSESSDLEGLFWYVSFIDALVLPTVGGTYISFRCVR